jgi:hypothetical protein
MNDYFLVKNLYNYEKVIPPPINLPKHLKSVYVTDCEENYKKAIDCGWDIVKKTDLFLTIEDKFERRKSVAFINCFPLKVVSEIKDSRYIFICDSNIVNLFNKYENFVNNCSDDFALFVTSGYYKGIRDNIKTECQISCESKRWNYNHIKIKTSTERYIKELNEKNINLDRLSIISAKYIGWNVRNENYEILSNILFKEYNENLQGNIILTYMYGLYSEKIYNFYTNDYLGGSLNPHNYPS